jgi:hypothetical protein
MPGSVVPSSLMVLNDLFVRAAAVAMDDFEDIQGHLNGNQG